MKITLIIACLLLTSCTAFIPKKVTTIEEATVAGVLKAQGMTLGSGTTKYFGETFSTAREIYGVAWLGTEAGYYIILYNAETNTTETFWSKDGTFPELERRAFLNMPRLAP